MKKIPTLFMRIFFDHKIVGITRDITDGCEEAFKKGVATVKYDGSCCAIINGETYKRYDCKKGKTPPEGAIPCSDPDPVTGHWPHWVKIGDGPEDKWFREAFNNSIFFIHDMDGTYEACGPHFQGNPHKFTYEGLVKHGAHVITDLKRDFNSVKKYLEDHPIEGIVFWLDGEPVCKIKRSDFGLSWPVTEVDNNARY